MRSRATAAGVLFAAGTTLFAGASGIPPARADVLDDVIDQALSLGDTAGLFQQLVYTPLHDGIQDWMHSSIGTQIDHVINEPFVALTGRDLIGDGTTGTQADPTGGAGGWLFGDGGAGWDSTIAGQAGGDGGAAGLFGTGGDGGNGGAGAAGGTGGAGGSLLGVGGAGGDGGDGADGTVGGAGGDGGNAAGLFGIGGDGGNAGDSSTTDSLPALGGAGGNGGPLGSHGDVGHFGTLAGVTPSASSDLTATGNWITDSDGKVVILHGMNEMLKIPPYEPSAEGFGDDDAAFLAANGFNAVRLGIIWAGVEPQPGVIDYAYLASIEQTIQTLSDHGIRVILDMHQDEYSSVFKGEGAPEWAVVTAGAPNHPQSETNPIGDFTNPAQNQAWDAFWANTPVKDAGGLENAYAQMWEAVADYFKGNSDVIGYEIMNEPHPGTNWVSTALGNPHFGAEQLTPFYNQVDSAIRAVDPATPVFFEPNELFDGGFPTRLGTVDDPNTVFSFHDYCEISFLCPGEVNLTAGEANTYAKDHHIPAMLTEFGATSDLTPIHQEMNAANQTLVGWTEWAFTGYNDITTSASPPSSESLVFNPNLPPTGDNVNTANLTALAEPYPQVVAGTPGSWSFDNGTFTFSYSTAMADGQGSFAAGSQTEISTPAIEFPNGYQVSVTGGHVVSAADAPTLVIASNAGANTVNVTVTAVASK